MDEQLAAFLKEHDIAYELFTHPPVFTCEEAKLHCEHIPGLPCKNLFLETDKGYVFAMLPDDMRLDKPTLKALIGAKSVAFAPPDALKRVLDITPGSVSPLCMRNATEPVMFLIEQAVWDAPIVTFHPNDNTQTLAVSHADWEKILAAMGKPYRVVRLTSATG